MSRNLINATKYFIISLCILTFGLAPTIAGAKPTPEEKCEIKKHKAAKKRAVVAVARKLSVLLHSLWLSGEEYEPLRNSERKSKRSAS